MGAGADAAAGLRVPASVGVEVSVADGVHDAQQTAVSVDGFDVLSVVAVQCVVVASPTGTGRVQTWKNMGVSRKCINKSDRALSI